MRPELVCRRARVCRVIRGEFWFFHRLVGGVGFCKIQAMVTPIFQIAPPVLARPRLFADSGRTPAFWIRFSRCHMRSFSGKV